MSKSHTDVHTTRLRNQEDRTSHNHPYEPSVVILSFLDTGAIRTNTRCATGRFLCAEIITGNWKYLANHFT